MAEAELHRIDAHLGGVRWAGQFAVDRPGRWQYTIEAWTDVFGTWRDELAPQGRGRPATTWRGRAVGGRRAAARGGRADALASRAGPDRARRAGSSRTDSVPASAKHDVALGEELPAAVERDQERHGRVTLDEPQAIEVDRLRARFGAWYELFPRSWGGLKGVERQLPRLAELGFDVVYLPPIHPIGLHQPQGPRQRADRGARPTPARRGRSATPPAATTRSTPSSARSTTCAR